MTENIQSNSDDHTPATPEATEDVVAVPAASATSPAASAASPTPALEELQVKTSFAGGTWIALIAGALLLIALLVFIMQNQQQLDLTIFVWQFTLPVGIGFLLAAVTGALIMAFVGGVRMFQLRRQIKKIRVQLAATQD
ncbi:lipopolysaccharide assembly LapA domain-containing protein [Corynebacterium sp. HS2168-gen11]|uniref:LapA family protein n=1 Tax=Corynebacterium sp. HS2168-gen11 TaxID=2974027 RepID=UPI00216B3719|nr:lipopolysaccharide assembly protein LapA domain-containing protein [Corynebacterium sp. HS2168-gen11]MCS4536299.1 lipopolysaccharide assembly protein LapA domain-containing protein [Corynebacterium sp. HS2168-gen11]